MKTQNEITGAIGESLVEIELLKRGISFLRMTGNNPFFDLIVNAEDGLKKVQIKTANKNKAHKHNFYLMNCAGAYDYLILVKMFNSSDPEFYIMSSSDVELKKGLTIGKQDKKYGKFKNNWGLLL